MQGEKRVQSDVHPDSPCLLLQHSAMQFVASRPILFPPFPPNMPHYTRMPTVSSEFQNCFRSWRPWDSPESTIGSHPSELRWMPLSPSGRYMTLTQGFWVLIACISTEPITVGKRFWTPRSQKIFHHSSMKLLLFPDLDLFTVSNQDFPHALHFLNSKVSLCKLSLANVKV